jgi:cysteine desulfurase
LTPISFGGGQEFGLRPGTLPVPLIAGLGLASEIAVRDYKTRNCRLLKIRDSLLRSLHGLDYKINGNVHRALPNTINLSIKGLDSEAAILMLKDLVSISNGSACTSSSYKPSHVLKAMNLPEDRIRGAIRFSWCHLTEDVNWGPIITRLSELSIKV